MENFIDKLTVILRKLKPLVKEFVWFFLGVCLGITLRGVLGM